jgi:hypothetical protein
MAKGDQMVKGFWFPIRGYFMGHWPLLGMLAGILALLGVACAESSLKVPYEVVRQWTIPAGGYGKVIVVDPSHRNTSDLKALGEQLKNDTRGDRYANVDIYDDIEAAGMRNDANAERLSAEDMAFHDLHLIGNYSRNGNTGHHSLVLWPNGWGNGQRVDIEY